jgi:hypothetical protein
MLLVSRTSVTDTTQQNNDLNQTISKHYSVDTIRKVVGQGGKQVFVCSVKRAINRRSVKVAHRCLCAQSSEQSIGGRCVVTKCHSSSHLRLSDREREPVVIGRFATVLVGKRVVSGRVRQVVFIYR